MTDVQIILPPGADMTDALDHGLVALTEAICQVTGEESAYGLGGRFGYGENYENDVFLMHRYCWCERDDCKWCSNNACGCHDSGMEYYIDGGQVDVAEYWALNEALLDGKMPHEVAEHGTPEYDDARAAWDSAVAERDRRLSVVYPERHHVCEPAGMMANRPRGASHRPNQTAPNFWHRRTGLKVWWYKWIGRDMESVGSADLQDVFSECLASLEQNGDGT